MTFCQFLLERAELHPNKGFWLMNIRRITEPQMPLLYSAIVYKQNAKDKGLLLNFCPFCGGDIRNWEKFDK